MKLPTVPTVYYSDEINEIVLISPHFMPPPSKYIMQIYEIRFDDCCYEYFTSCEDYLTENWPDLVKIGEL